MSERDTLIKLKKLVKKEKNKHKKLSRILGIPFTSLKRKMSKNKNFLTEQENTGFIESLVPCELSPMMKKLHEQEEKLMLPRCVVNQDLLGGNPND